jgi:hypothetical protein
MTIIIEEHNENCRCDQCYEDYLDSLDDGCYQAECAGAIAQLGGDFHPEDDDPLDFIDQGILA